MARATKEEAQETRSRILDAAEEVFYTRGVSRSSLAHVADAAAVTRGAIYWHFRNKSELFEAMCERVRLPMETMMAASADLREPDPLGQLCATWVFIMQETVRNPRSRRVLDILFLKCELVDREDPIWVRQHECHLEGMANMESILRNAVVREQLPADLDIRLAAVALHANLVGLVTNWLFSPDSFDLAQDAQPLVDACIDSLRHAPSLRLKKA